MKISQTLIKTNDPIKNGQNTWTDTKVIQMTYKHMKKKLKIICH